MANEKFCGKCGAKMKAEGRFCPVCGAPQSVDEAVEAVAASAPVEEISQKAKEIKDAAVQEVSQVVNNENLEGGATAEGIDGKSLKKLLPLAGIGAAVVAIIIIAIVLVVNLTKYTKIDPEELCRITYSGVDGQGSAVVSFAFDEETTFYCDKSLSYLSYYADDEEEIKEAEKQILKAIMKLDPYDVEELADDILSDEEEFKEYLKENYKDLKTSDYLSIDEDTLAKAFEKADDEDEAMEMRDAILENVEFEIDVKQGKLKNGDKIKVKVDFDEDELKEYNIKLTKTEFEVEVKGLMKGEEIDMFEGVKLNVEGYEGNSEVYVSTTDDCSDFVKENFSFYVSSDNRYELSNGDKVVVEGYYNGYDYDSEIGGIIDEEAEKCYLFESSATKEFEVSGLTELEETDIFSYVEVVYDGMGDDVDIELEWKEDAPESITESVDWSKYYEYNVEDGQVVTFEIASWCDDYMAEAGIKPKSYTWEYTVDMSLAPRYATADDVNGDSFSEEFLTFVTNSLEESAKDDDYFSGLGNLKSVGDIAYKKSYMKVYNDGDGNIYSKIYAVKCTFEYSGETVEKTVWVLLSKANITADADGVITPDMVWATVCVGTSVDDFSYYIAADDDSTVKTY